MDAEIRLRALRDQVTGLVERLGDVAAAREAERRFDVLAAEVRADTPLADVARTAGAGLVVAAARWDDLGVECARLVGQLLASIEVELARDEADEEAELEWPRGAAEPVAAAAMDDAGPDEIGPPVYPPGEEP